MEEYIVVCRLALMLQMSLVNPWNWVMRRAQRTIGTRPPGAKSLNLILVPPGMAKPLSIGVIFLRWMSHRGSV
jgi:hypothetical protein